jgi:hypothetical protein
VYTFSTRSAYTVSKDTFSRVVCRTLDDRAIRMPMLMTVQVTTRHSVVAPGKSWSNFVVVTTLLVDSKVAVADYWSAKK